MVNKTIYDTGAEVVSFDSPTLNGQINSSEINKILLDKFSNWYDLEGQILLGFPLMSKYANIIKANLEDYEINPEHKLRPEYVSYELYGTTDLWYILLYINEMATVNDFTKDVIKVFPDRLISDINRMIMNEGKLLSTKSKPREIKKHFLKHLNEPSEEQIVDDDDKRAGWMESTITTSKKDDLLNKELTKYTETEYGANKDIVRDHLNRKIKRFELDPRGLKQIPSCYYRDGFKRTYKSRIKLVKGINYSLNGFYNGTVQLVVKDKGNEVINLSKFHSFNESTLIYDYREANEYELENRYPGESSKPMVGIRFDEETGRYVAPSNKDYLINAGTSGSTSKRIQDVRRLDEYDNLFINLGYKSSTPVGATDKGLITLTIIVRYKDGYEDKIVLDEGNGILNTMGKLAYIKSRVPYNKRPYSNIEGIYAGIQVKDGCEGSLEIMGVSGQTDNEVKAPFNVSKTGWYDMELTYEYKTRDRDDIRLFKDDRFEGIYFNPTITELKGDGKIDHSRNVLIQDYAESNTGTDITDRLSNPIMFPQTSDWKRLSTTVYTSNFNFPSKYIFEFRLEHLSKRTGGGIGFVLDYDPQSNSGYMFWIGAPSSTTQNNDALSDRFNPNAGYDILPTGFYELDDVYGDVNNIFLDDDTHTIKVSNYKPLNIEGKYIKVIKKENRLKIYLRRDDSEYDYLHPEIDLEDISNYHIKGKLGFIAMYAQGKLYLDDYIIWDQALSKETEEW